MLSSNGCSDRVSFTAYKGLMSYILHCGRAELVMGHLLYCTVLYERAIESSGDVHIGRRQRCRGHEVIQ